MSISKLCNLLFIFQVCDRDGDATKARIDVAFDLVDDDSFVDKNLTVVDDILGGRLHSALRDIANTSILPEDAELEEEDGDEDYYLEEVWSDDLVPSQAKLKHEKKRHCCLFCGEMFSKIRRHLIRAHSKEMCVQRALAFNPKSDKYDQEFDRLRFRGDYEHNIKVMTQEKEGGIIVCRERSSSDMKDNEVSYLPCIHCFGFFRKTELSRHVQRCRFVVNVSDLNRRTEAVSAGRCLLLASCFPAKYPSKFIELINKMKVDSCSKVAQSDKLIMELGYYAYEGFTSGKTGKKIVTAKMREMSRLLMSAREIMGDPSACLDDLLKPSSFDLVVEATRNVAKFTAQEDAQICDSFSIPSMALKCGFSLKLAAELSLVRALKCEMPEVAQERRNFITLYETSWSRKISSIALLSLKERKIDKGQTLPLTSDIQLITKHINEYLSHIDTEKLKSSPSYWKEVAEYVAIRLSIFNKRRASEPFKLRVSAWQKARSCKDVDDTTLSALSELEKQMLYRLTIVNVRGKRAQRPVPLLVSNEIAEIIDELIRTRHHASSPYVFCSSGSLGYISPFVARTNVVSSCQGLQFPARLSSTNLRKYIATVSQILEMRENELGWLSNHLGHSLNVHHNFYRLHENTIELAKVGKLLLAIEAGRFDQLKGKTIEEIDVNDIEIDYDIDDKSDAKKDDLNESGDVEASIGSQARELKRGDQKSQAPPENNGARIQAKEFEDESIYHEGSVDFRGAPLSIKQVEKKKNRLAVLDSDEYESEVDKDDSDYQPTKKTRKVQKARANERRIRRTTKPKGATATTTNNKSEPGHGQEDPQKDKSEPGPGQEDPQKDKSEPGPGQEDPQKDKSEPGPGQEDPQKDKSAPSSEEVKKKLIQEHIAWNKDENEAINRAIEKIEDGK
uniref:C2H2-type domain-containing protein n=2 Tax=Macrostomum lignano TaxID=282301 RepID=A0A1I8J1L2_9PLAT